MTRVAKLASPAAIIAILAVTPAPAHAQFAGMDASQMQQFAPMLEMMKQKMGKRRFGQIMQMIGPMLVQMQTQDGFTGMSGGSGGLMPMMGSFGIGHMMSMVGAMRGGHRRARRHRG